MSNREQTVPTVYMRASVAYLDQIKSMPKDAVLCNQFQPFIAELIQSLSNLQPGDEFVLSCGFVREEIKPKPGVLN